MVGFGKTVFVREQEFLQAKLWLGFLGWRGCKVHRWRDIRRTMTWKRWVSLRTKGDMVEGAKKKPWW